MKAIDYVKENYQDAVCEKHRTSGPMGSRHYFIYTTFKQSAKQLIGDGETESKAWVDAKLNILESKDNER